MPFDALVFFLQIPRNASIPIYICSFRAAYFSQFYTHEFRLLMFDFSRMVRARCSRQPIKVSPPLWPNYWNTSQICICYQYVSFNAHFIEDHSTAISTSLCINRATFSFDLTWPFRVRQNGETALHAAAMFGYLPVVKQLVAAGSDIMWKNQNGLTAMQVAKQQNFTSVVEYLDERRAQRMKQHNRINCWNGRKRKAVRCCCKYR